MNEITNMNGKRAYLTPHVNIITMETNYGVMEDRSIPVDPNAPATGDGNAKRFDMSDDMWDNNREGFK